MLGLQLLYVLAYATRVWTAEDHTIVPMATTTCPDESGDCKTLYQYLRGSDAYFTSNTTFTFLPGHHELNITMAISDIDNLVLRSEGEATISCNKGVGLSFTNISSLEISGLIFLKCGSRIPPEDFLSAIDRYATTFLNTSVPVRAGLLLNYIRDLEMMDVEVIGGDGYGVLAVNVLGAVVESSVFRDNNNESFYLSQCYQESPLDCKGGNFMLVYTDLEDCPHEALIYSLTISGSEFVGGVDVGLAYQQFVTAPLLRNDLLYLGGAGLGLVMMQSSYGVEVLIDSCIIEHNLAQTGANLYISVYDFVDNSSITIQESQLVRGNARSASVLESKGIYLIAAGLFYIYGTIPVSQYTPVCQAIKKYQVEVLTIRNTDISYNRATLNVGVFMVMWAKTFIDFTREIHLVGVRMMENDGDATIISSDINDVSALSGALSFRTYVTNCTFSGNRYGADDIQAVIGSNNPSVYYTLSVSSIVFRDCNWSHNVAPAIRSSKSIISLSGTNQFINNSAVDGAAMTLQEGSVIRLAPGSVTIFRDNVATNFGGAIFANMFTYTCFYQLESLNSLPMLIFDGNLAGQAGDAVYANLDVCLIESGHTSVDSLSLLREISQFLGNDSTSTSLIAATPNRLCHCVGGTVVNNCSNDTINISTFPGKIFNVSAEARSFVGGGLAPSFISATVIQSENYAQVSSVETEEKLDKGCSVVRYKLVGLPDQSVTIQIVPNSNRIYFPIFIKATLLSCPSGFAYSENTKACECASFIVTFSALCNIDTETFTIDSSYWIGYIEFTSSPKVGIGDCREEQHCSIEDSTKVVSLADQDAQCTDNHAGVMCGQCLPGYSVSLGTNNCMRCSNAYLALIIVFAAAGVLLLVLLSICNVTIGTGRINSMLFYANVLRVVNFDFFAIRNSAFTFFQTIVNWINFDFSIESCFYNGLSHYAKAWLQFAFPAYLFALLGLIVFAVQKSSRLANAAPHNILAVFTTIVLMSYTKILRASVAVFVTVEIATNDTTYSVWLYDGSIVYFSPKHAVLFAFSIVVLVVWVLPYTFVMVAYPFVWKFTAHENTIFEQLVCWFRRQLIKLKPILETHDGPFEPKYQYWNGLLISMRLVIFFFTLSFYDGGSSGNYFKLAVVTVISLVLLGVVVAGKVYRCHINRKVEFVNLLNLAVLEFVLIVIGLTTADSDIAKVYSH